MSETPETPDAGTEPAADATPEPDTTTPIPASESDGEASTEPPEGDGTEPESPSHDREAAKYRRQLRAVEAERDRLRSQVEALQRAQVETMVKDSLHDPSDFWHRAPALSELLDPDTGTIDRARVDAARDEIVRAAPHLARSVAAPASMVTAVGVEMPEQGKRVDARNPFRRARGLPEIEDVPTESLTP